MRSIVAFTSTLILLGCAAQHPEQPYVYRPPVTVTLTSLRRTNNYFVAVFTVANVSSEPMWFDGEGRDNPACCIEYKNMPLAEHTPGGYYWGDTGLGRYMLAPGESSLFNIRREQFSGPFRAGVWLSADPNNETQHDLIYWSNFVSP
jgi:hypothetical protein